MKGRHQTLGVMYLDTTTPASRFVESQGGVVGKFAEGHLSLAIAIAHQAALAVEETRYYQAMVNAERLAAVGQTVAALSHHIKNILQGLLTGGEMLERGIKEKDDVFLQQGWKVVRKNQGKVHDLVMDMLSYSKEREPNIQTTDLNVLALEVLELMLPRAKELGVELKRVRVDDTLPPVPCDPEGIHRALLNIVTNAIDAVEGEENPKVVIGVIREKPAGPTKGEWVQLVVKDNGPGIPPEKLEEVFRPFVSTKGSKGTGLGLAVSRKILREHGGDVLVESVVGQGSLFRLRLPLSLPTAGDSSTTQHEMPVAPPLPD
jgi:signal transduction histidine kinase